MRDRHEGIVVVLDEGGRALNIADAVDKPVAIDLERTGDIRLSIGATPGADSISVQDPCAAAVTRALSRSGFARPYIWRLMSLRRFTFPSTWPLDQGSVIAAAMAALSASTPAAKLARVLFLATAIHGSRRAASLHRIIAWKRSIRSRATINSGTAVSMAALTSAILAGPASRSMVRPRAMVRALSGDPAGWPRRSSRRRRVAHSLTTRSEAANPGALNLRQSSAPTRQPPVHSASSRTIPGVQRTLASTEDGVALAAHDLADGLAR